MHVLGDSEGPEAMRVRLYLVTLQLMFVAVLVTHLSHAEPVTRMQGIMLTVLGG